MKADLTFYDQEDRHGSITFSVSSTQLIEELQDVFESCGDVGDDQAGVTCYLSDIHSEMVDLLQSLESSNDVVYERQDDMLEKDLVLLTITK